MWTNIFIPLKEPLGHVEPGAHIQQAPCELHYSLLDPTGIRGAGLDVSEPEPLPAEHPLVQCEAVTLLPHMGSATRQARHTMAELGVDNVLAFLQEKEMPTRVKI